MPEQAKPRAATPMIISAIAVLISLYHLYMFTLGSGQYDLIYQHRPTHLMLFLVLTFLTHGFSGKARKGFRLKGMPLIDIALALLAVVIWGYLLINWDYLTERASMVSAVLPLDLVLGALLILLIMEATRRVVGLPLIWVTLLFSLYAYFGPHFSGLWYHPGISLVRMVDWLFLSREGIWGDVLGVSSTFIFLFILFGQFVVTFGAGEFFTDLAKALAGRQTGGPAKAAVIASALFGTVSGSAAANVATTGTFTIPMMKNLGYRPSFAAAVECAASTGGLLSPPIMSAIVFLMSDLSGIPYTHICIAAAVPAILYYMSLFIQVHFETLKMGLGGMAAKDVPPLGKTLRSGGHFSLPFIAVVVVLLLGYSPLRAALWGMAASVFAGVARGKGLRQLPRLLWASLESGAKASIMVVICCAAAAIFVGLLEATGIGGKFGSAIMAASGGNLFPALIMGMVGCLIMGLPLPPPATYLLTAIMVAPTLVNMGVPVMAAHLFAVYYSVLGQITPPAGAAMFVAGAISGTNPMTVGFQSMKLAVVAFVVPFVFVYSPALLMVGNAAEILGSVIVCVFAFLALTSGLVGWLIRTTSPWERGLLMGGGVVLLFPGLLSHSVGIGAVLVVLASQGMRYRFFHNLFRARVK